MLPDLVPEVNLKLTLGITTSPANGARRNKPHFFAIPQCDSEV